MGGVWKSSYSTRLYSHLVWLSKRKGSTAASGGKKGRGHRVTNNGCVSPESPSRGGTITSSQAKVDKDRASSHLRRIGEASPVL